MRIPKLRLPMWLGPRAYLALAIVAVLFGASAGVHLLGPIAVVASLLVAAALVIDGVTGPTQNGIAIRRIVPAHLALRVPIHFTYEIENHSRASVRIGIAEAPLRTLRSQEAEVVCSIPSSRRCTVELPMLPIARGRDVVGSLYVWYENQVGLLRRRIVLEAAAPIRIFPDLSAVERYGSLRVRNRLIEAGMRRMRMRGIGTEFESLRDYTTGDAFRSVDWKATAKRGRLMVAQREIERSQDVVVLLDCGRLMTPRIGEQRKLDYALTSALSLASIASLASDRVGVVAFASNIIVARAPRSTASSVRALSDALCDIEPRFEESDYAHAFAYTRAHLHRRSLIVLFTDAIDPVAQSLVLAELSSLSKRHVVLCIFMNDDAIGDALRTVPVRVDDAYRTGVALGLQQERATAAATLERRGIRVIDAPARSLSMAAIDAYLRIKQSGSL